MEIKGKVIELGEVKSGTTKNNKEWKKQNVIIETDGQYPKKVCLQLWNDKIDAVSTGSIVSLSFDAESREYKGSWYTDLKVFKIDSEKKDDGFVPIQKEQKEYDHSEHDGTELSPKSDDLPF